jgi:hypothetical protein
LLVIPGWRVGAEPENTRGASGWIPGSLATLAPRNDVETNGDRDAAIF